MPDLTRQSGGFHHQPGTNHGPQDHPLVSRHMSLTVAYLVVLAGVRAAKSHDVSHHSPSHDRRMHDRRHIWLVAYVLKQALFGRESFQGPERLLVPTSPSSLRICSWRSRRLYWARIISTWASIAFGSGSVGAMVAGMTTSTHGERPLSGRSAVRCSRPVWCTCYCSFGIGADTMEYAISKQENERSGHCCTTKAAFRWETASNRWWSRVSRNGFGGNGRLLDYGQQRREFTRMTLDEQNRLFSREPKHFRLPAPDILPSLEGQTVIWSSPFLFTGKNPTIAMTLYESVRAE